MTPSVLRGQGKVVYPKRDINIELETDSEDIPADDDQPDQLNTSSASRLQSTPKSTKSPKKRRYSAGSALVEHLQAKEENQQRRHNEKMERDHKRMKLQDVKLAQQAEKFELIRKLMIERNNTVEKSLIKV